MNSNQLAIEALEGQLDLQVNNGGVFNGKLASTVSGSVKPGQTVKLDPASTTRFPTFVLAADDEEAFGTIIRTVKQGSYVAGDLIQVATKYNGPVQFFKAHAEISPADVVERRDSDGKVQPLASNARLGIALDFGVADSLVRIILSPEPMAS